MKTFIVNASIINEDKEFIGSVLIENELIVDINPINPDLSDTIIIDAKGNYLIPGVIDDQVHFREPGNCEKADIESESKAAILGGVTSFMDMPNNKPPVCDATSLESKYFIAKEKSYANYSFYLGASNDNFEEILKTDNQSVCGLKVFMGSSTGNMLVDNSDTLENIFRSFPSLIATHCEEEEIIKNNLSEYKLQYNEEIPFNKHHLIRSREACIESTKKALELAVKHNTQLHILHISTKEEVDLIAEAQKKNPKISAETCVHFLWFNADDYDRMGSFIKCNPAIKEKKDMLAIRQGIKDGIIKVVATDHAPHLLSEKQGKYLEAPSGLPLVQHSLQAMLEFVNQSVFTIPEVIRYMCHNPADLYRIEKRGYIRKGYYADLVIVDRNKPYKVSKDNIAYKCKWSPFLGYQFTSAITHTFVNGEMVVNDGVLTGARNSKRLKFKRN